MATPVSAVHGRSGKRPPAPSDEVHAMNHPFSSSGATRRRLVVATAWLPLVGCALAPERPVAPARHDFGPAAPLPATAAMLPAPVAIGTVVAPDWLDSHALAYRLLWDTPGRLRTYAGTSWAAAPSALLAERLRERTATRGGSARVHAAEGAAPVAVLRVDLAEFAQWFDAPDQARAVVRVRASLLSALTRVPIAQQAFSSERPCATPDAPGAVSALIVASQQVVDDLLDWTAKTLARG
jgi:cholesterol transport system auxiliary component